MRESLNRWLRLSATHRQIPTSMLLWIQSFYLRRANSCCTALPVPAALSLSLSLSLSEPGGIRSSQEAKRGLRAQHPPTQCPQCEFQAALAAWLVLKRTQQTSFLTCGQRCRITYVCMEHGKDAHVVPAFRWFGAAHRRGSAENP